MSDTCWKGNGAIYLCYAIWNCTARAYHPTTLSIPCWARHDTTTQWFSMFQNNPQLGLLESCRPLRFFPRCLVLQRASLVPRRLNDCMARKLSMPSAMGRVRRRSEGCIPSSAVGAGVPRLRQDRMARGPSSSPLRVRCPPTPYSALGRDRPVHTKAYEIASHRGDSSLHWPLTHRRHLGVRVWRRRRRISS